MDTLTILRPDDEVIDFSGVIITISGVDWTLTQLVTALKNMGHEIERLRARIGELEGVGKVIQ